LGFRLDLTITFTIALAVIVVLVGLMWSTGDGGRYWAAGWCCLYAGGAVALLAKSAPILGSVYPALGTAFAALLYAGVRSFVGRTIPSELIAAAVVVAAARGIALPFVSETVTQVMGTLVIAASVVASVYELSRKQPDALLEMWGRALRFSFPVLVVVSAIYSYGRSTGTAAEGGLTAWFFGGLLVLVVQTAALLERRASKATRELGTLEALLEAIPVGLVLTDDDGTIRVMNEEFARLADTTDTRPWIDRNFAELSNRVSTLLVEGDATEVALSVTEERVRRGAQMVARDFHYLDGRVAHATVRPVRDEAGEAIGRLWSLRDITTEKQLQEQLHRARQLETLGRLAGGVAHDFNNKLTTIIGNTNLVRLEVEADSPMQESLADLEGAAEYCAELTKDLLDFAQQSPRSLVAIDPVHVINGVAKWMREELPPGVTLHVHIDPVLPPLLADSTQLERVLTNLVLNARDAVGETGRIDIEARRGFGERERRVEIAVVDDGHGLPDELRERIFDPFFSTKDVGRGSGLGLATVFGIVTSHGGEVLVESAPGKGSRFLTTWPMASEAVKRDAPLGVGQVAGENRRVLVVDDEDTVRRVVVGALEGAGYNVSSARGGREALELCERETFDLLVVDVTMPEMTGEEFVERQRSSGGMPPVLFMSGNLGVLVRRPGSAMTLAKPFRLETLISAVAQALEMPH
jgi:signal transduction histidine kinase/CheY-like chemotaxis protein